MVPPQWFLPYDMIFQILTGIVALGVGIYAYIGYRWVKERTLYALFLAFLLIAAALFIKGLSLGYGWTHGPHAFEQSMQPWFLDIGFLLYYSFTISAYGVLVYAYARRMRELLPMAAVMGPAISLVDPSLELVIVILLAIIVAAQFMHLMAKRSVGAMVVTLSFSLLLIGHVMMMLSVTFAELFIVGSLLQLASFAMLMYALYRPRGQS